MHSIWNNPGRVKTLSLLFTNKSIEVGKNVAQANLIVNLEEAFLEVDIGLRIILILRESFQRVCDGGSDEGDCELLSICVILDLTSRKECL